MLSAITNTMSDVPHYFLYGETDPSHTLDYLHISQLEESLPKHNWDIHPHRHGNMHQLLIVEQGSVLVRVCDLLGTRNGFCILSIPAREVHGFVHQPGVCGYMVTIVESFLRGSFAESERQEFPGLLREVLMVQPKPGSREERDLRELVHQLVQEYREPQAGHTALIGGCLKMLFVMLARFADHLRSTDPDSDARIAVYEQFLHLLEQRYREHWNVGQYAGTLGLTGSRLNRLCQRYAGQNALQLIHDRLVTEAKRQLIYANRSVNEVAYDLGFKDPAYFSRFFTKHCSEAPGQFKKRIRERNLASDSDTDH